MNPGLHDRKGAASFALECLDAAAALYYQLACTGAAGGFAIGIALGFITKWLLSLLRSRGAKAPEEMALTVAMAYLAFYLANAPGTPIKQYMYS